MLYGANLETFQLSRILKWQSMLGVRCGTRTLI